MSSVMNLEDSNLFNKSYRSFRRQVFCCRLVGWELNLEIPQVCQMPVSNLISQRLSSIRQAIFGVLELLAGPRPGICQFGLGSRNYPDSYISLPLTPYTS